MADEMWSDIIEIPELAASKCKDISSVPRVTGATWTWGGSVDDPSTTRLKLDTSGKWQVTTGDDAIACAAANSTSSALSGDIKLYPILKMYAYKSGLQDSGNDMLNEGTFYIANDMNPQQYFVSKPTTAAWSTYQTLYYDFTTGLFEKTGGTNRIATDGTYTATPSGTSRGLYWFRLPYIENEVRSPDKIEVIELPKMSGANTITGLSKVAIDISGNYFSFNDSVASSAGIYEEYWSLASVPASASTFKGFHHTTSKIGLSPDNVKMSSLNPQVVLVVPKFGTNGTTKVLNSFTQQAHQNIISGGTDVCARHYYYYYILRKYNLLTDQLLTFQTKTWKPLITLDIPSSPTWTRTPVSDSLPWSPPGAVDWSADHRFILTSDYQSVDAPTWKIIRESPFSTGFHASRWNATTRPPIGRTYYYYWLNVDPISGGKSQFTTLNDSAYGYVQDLSEPWNYGMASLDDIGTPTTLQVKFQKQLPDTTWSDLSSFSAVPKTSWFTADGTQYIRFEGSQTLAALGITDPLVQRRHYRAIFRLYADGVSPYSEAIIAWGDPVTNSTDFFGSIGGFNPDSYMPYPGYIPAIKARTNMDDEVACDYLPGFHEDFQDPGISWAGSLTYSVSGLADGFSAIKATSNVTPTVTNPEIVRIEWYNSSHPIQIRRKSDGLFLHQYLTTKDAAAKGLVWSRIAKYGYHQHGAPVTYGSGIYSSFITSFVSNNVLVHGTGEFEIMANLLAKITYHDKRETYATYSQTSTLTIT